MSRFINNWQLSMTGDGSLCIEYCYERPALVNQWKFLQFRPPALCQEVRRILDDAVVAGNAKLSFISAVEFDQLEQYAAEEGFELRPLEDPDRIPGFHLSLRYLDPESGDVISGVNHIRELNRLLYEHYGFPSPTEIHHGR